MSNGTAASSDLHHQTHMEVRAPIEVVLTRVTWFVFGVIEVLIAVRFVLRLVSANTEAGFVRLVQGVSGIFMAPFNMILKTQTVSGATFEWSALIAIGVYALIAWGIVALIRAINPREHAETIERDEKNENVAAR